MAERRGEAQKLRLAEDFGPVSTAEWEEAIRRDLKGVDYDTALLWRTREGLTVRPYYRSDVLQENHTGDLLGRTRQSGGWEIRMTDTASPHAIRADAVLEAGGDAVQQLGVALAEAAEKLEAGDHPCGSVEFVFAVGSSYFLEIAKLRAMRLLWIRMVEQFGPEAATISMHLHVRTRPEMDEGVATGRNMLRATTQAMSAVIGGCDSLTVVPLGFPAGSGERLAVNLQHVLAEEGHLDRVADPAAGSYYVEALTSMLAKAAWKLFQRVEAHGGCARVRESGWLAKQIASAGGEERFE